MMTMMERWKSSLCLRAAADALWARITSQCKQLMDSTAKEPLHATLVRLRLLHVL
jgi:hypothetical protein